MLIPKYLDPQAIANKNIIVKVGMKAPRRTPKPNFLNFDSIFIFSSRLVITGLTDY